MARMQTSIKLSKTTRHLKTSRLSKYGNDLNAPKKYSKTRPKGKSKCRSFKTYKTKGKYLLGDTKKRPRSLLNSRGKLVTLFILKKQIWKQEKTSCRKPQHPSQSKSSTSKYQLKERQIEMLMINSFLRCLKNNFKAGISARRIQDSVLRTLRLYSMPMCALT